MYERNLRIRTEVDRQRRTGPEDTVPSRDPTSYTWYDNASGKAGSDHLRNQCITQSRRVTEQIDEPVRQQMVKLVLQLFLGKDLAHRRSILFAGVDSYDATPLITAWIGELLADLSRGTVCLIDANLRSSSLHECFGLTNGKGLAELLGSSSAALDEFAQRISSNLWVLTGGTATSSQARLIPSETFRRAFATFTDQFQYVLVSAPPICASAEAVTVGSCCDGVIMIVEHETKRDSAITARGLLEAGGANLVGAIGHNRRV